MGYPLRTAAGESQIVIANSVLPATIASMTIMIQPDLNALRALRQEKAMEQEKFVEFLVNQLNFKMSLRKWQDLEAGGRMNYDKLRHLAKLFGKDYRTLLPQPCSIPKLQWNKHRHSPAMLLQAEMAIVPFALRTADVRYLRNWCNSPGELGIQILTAPGGMGKTRLALHVCEWAKRTGWRTGFVDPCRFNDSEWDAALEPSDPIFLVFDYGEHRYWEFSKILAKIVKSKSTKIRLLILARSLGDWYHQLQSDRNCGYLLNSRFTTKRRLGPISMSVNERKQCLRAAVLQYARELGLPAPTRLDVDLKKPDYQSVLLIHMSALAAIYGGNPTDEMNILNHMLTRERRFWRERRIARGLNESLDLPIELFMAKVTLNGGISEAVDVLPHLEAFYAFKATPTSDLIAIAELLRECYPGTSVWIEPLRPDTLGEFFSNCVYTAHPELCNHIFRTIATVK